MLIITKTLDRESSNSRIEEPGILQGNYNNLQFIINLTDKGIAVPINANDTITVIVKSTEGINYAIPNSYITIQDNKVIIDGSESMTNVPSQHSLTIKLNNLYSFSTTYNVNANPGYSPAPITPADHADYAQKNLSNVSATDFKLKADSSGIATVDNINDSSKYFTDPNSLIASRIRYDDVKKTWEFERKENGNWVEKFKIGESATVDVLRLIAGDKPVNIPIDEMAFYNKKMKINGVDAVRPHVVISNGDEFGLVYYDEQEDKVVYRKSDGTKAYIPTTSGGGGTPVPITGDFVNRDGSNVNQPFSNTVINTASTDILSEALLKTAAYATIADKTNQANKNVENIFKTNYHEQSNSIDIASIDGEGLTLMYQFNGSNEIITQKLPPSSSGKLLIVSTNLSPSTVGSKLIFNQADGELINGSNKPIEITTSGTSGVFIPFKNLSGYEYYSVNELSNNELTFYDNSNVKYTANSIVSGSGIKLNPLNGNLEISTSSLSFDDGFLGTNEDIKTINNGGTITFDNVYFGSNVIKTNSVIGFSIDFVGTAMGNGYIEVSVYNGNSVLKDNNNQPITVRKNVTQLQKIGTISKMFYMETSTDIIPTLKINFNINGQNAVNVFNKSVFVIQNIKNTTKEGIPLLGYSQLTGYDLKYSIDNLSELYNLEQLKGEATSNSVEIQGGTEHKFEDGSIGNFLTTGKYAISNSEISFLTDGTGFKFSFNKIFNEYESKILVGKNVTVSIEYLTPIQQDDLKLLIMKWTATSEPTTKIINSIENGIATFEPNWVEISSKDLSHSVSLQPVDLNSTIPSDSKRVAIVLYNKNSNIANRIDIKKITLTIPQITMFSYDYITPNVPTGITIKKSGNSQIGTTEIEFSSNEVTFDALNSKVSIGEDVSKANINLENVSTNDLETQMNKVSSFWNKANNTLDNVSANDFNRILKRTAAYRELANRKSLTMDAIKDEFEAHYYDSKIALDLATLEGEYIIVNFNPGDTQAIVQPIPDAKVGKTFLIYLQIDQDQTGELQLLPPSVGNVNGNRNPMTYNKNQLIGMLIPLDNGNYQLVTEPELHNNMLTVKTDDGNTVPVQKLESDESLSITVQEGNTALIKGISLAPSYYAKYSTPKNLNDGFNQSDTIKYYNAILSPDKIIQDRMTTLIKTGTICLICGRIAPVGRAKISGYISISIIDTSTNNIINDINNGPCIFRRNYLAGERFDFVEVAAIIKPSKNTNVAIKVQYYFGTELLSTGSVTEGITGILIHDLSQEKSIGLMDYELDTRQNILWSKHDFTKQITDFSEHLKRNEEKVVIKALNGNRDTDGWGIEGTTDFNYSISNQILTLSNVGSESFFGLSYVFSAEDTRILKNKDVLARVTLSTNENDWIVQFVAWKGNPDDYANQIMLNLNGNNLELLEGWFALENASTTLSKTEIETLTTAYDIPADVSNLALLIRSSNKNSPQFLNIKSILITTEQSGIYYSLYAPELEDEKHFYQDDKIARGHVLTDYSFKATTDYNFLPFGSYANGDANLKFLKTPWAKIYNDYDYNTNIKFENSGNAEIEVVAMFKSSSKINETINVAFAKLKAGTGANVSDYEIINGSEFSFTLEYQSDGAVVWQKIPTLKAQFSAGDQLCMLFKASHNDVITVNAVQVGNYAVFTRIDFYEFTPSSPDMSAMTTKLDELERQIKDIPLQAIQKILARIQITDNAYDTNTFIKLDNNTAGTTPKVEAIVIGNIPSAAPPAEPVENTKNNNKWSW